MGKLVIVQGQPGAMEPIASYADTGWEIIGSYAYHSGCNAGTMDYIGVYPFEDGKQYDITYVVDQLSSGSVRSKLGASLGTLVSQAGSVTDTFIYHEGDKLSFYSDGVLRLKVLKVSLHEATIIENYKTFAFHTIRKVWATYYSYEPEMMMKFGNNFFSFKNGSLWLHNVNEVRNSFYGVNNKSQIDFYVNPSPTTVKIFYSTRVTSNKPWYAPATGDISIPPVEGRKKGMRSRLKLNNFKNLQGAFFADFLRNIDDVRFQQELSALMKGEPLRGRYMEFRLENRDTTEVVLLEIDVKTSPSQFTY